MNNLYNLLMNKGNVGQNGANMGGFLQRLNQFKKTFNGNPQEIVQGMLNNGKINQAQYDQAVKMTNQIINALK